MPIHMAIRNIVVIIIHIISVNLSDQYFKRKENTTEVSINNSSFIGAINANARAPKPSEIEKRYS